MPVPLGGGGYWVGTARGKFAAKKADGSPMRQIKGQKVVSGGGRFKKGVATKFKADKKSELRSLGGEERAQLRERVAAKRNPARAILSKYAMENLANRRVEGAKSAASVRARARSVAAARRGRTAAGKGRRAAAGRRRRA